MTTKFHPWHKTALAAAATALFTLAHTNVLALSLGPITVQSSLGEPLRAEIDVPDSNAEEISSLKASVASPDAFRAAGLEYNAAMSGLQVSVQKRSNGRVFIRLTSDKPINEPFVDMILEASWATGRIVRDYTMLFDPPTLRAAAATATALPQAAGVAPAVTPAAAASQAATTAATAVKPRQTTTMTTPAPAAAKSSSLDGQKITVQEGDTASKIARAVKPANVSLDQMLVALLRSNPDAFIDNDINRIKRGSVLNVPTPDEALATGTSEATQLVIASSKNFNDFRKKLASSAPKAQVATADRQASGKVQTQIEEKKPSANAPDKLTLSKGALKAQAEVEKITKERAAKEAAERAAEVAKNISDLKQLGAASKPAAVAATPAAPIASTPALPSVAAVTAQTPAVAPEAVTPPPVVASAPVEATPAVVTPPVVAPVKAPAAPVAAVEEPGLIEQLTGNPLVLAGAGALVALLAGFGIYRARERKKAQALDSAFLESRLQPDSFFGASGGQRVDTNDSVASGSSMVYSPSQLDAADDVDPVAEADVYLAYGRDLQAEEILKEALRHNAARVAIHQKLLEIYAKRRDTKNFERAATEAFKQTGGDSAEWHRICDLGLSIDPTNPLYQPGGAPSADGSPSRPMPFDLGNNFAAATAPQTPQAAPASPVDLDLDLDFSLDEENASVISDLGSTEQTSKMAPIAMDPPPLDMDFAAATQKLPEIGLPSLDDMDATISFAPPKTEAPAPLPDFNIGDVEDFGQQAAVSFGSTVSMQLVTEAPKPPVAPAEDTGMLEFDLGSLSLDLGEQPQEPATTGPTPLEDPLATKLALAEEFSAIGDDDGARALIEEVIAEASGDMRARAQNALSKLS